MSKFKVGDKVLRVSPDFEGVVLGTTYTITGVSEYGGYVDVDGSTGEKYGIENFELAEESIRDIYAGKFKVGDKVRRTAYTFGKAIQGGVYEVSEVSSFVGINLVGHEVVKGSYNYDYRGFELYLGDMLTPLQAAEALFNREALQVYDTCFEKWHNFSSGLETTLADLEGFEFRLKPKTIVINGVDVPEPMSSLPSERFVWGIAGLDRVYSLDVQCRAIPKYYWSTEEDAQKVLDAMMIPFK